MWMQGKMDVAYTMDVEWMDGRVRDGFLSSRHGDPLRTADAPSRSIIIRLVKSTTNPDPYLQDETSNRSVPQYATFNVNCRA